MHVIFRKRIKFYFLDAKHDIQLIFIILKLMFILKLLIDFLAIYHVQNSIIHIIRRYCYCFVYCEMNDVCY